MREGSAFLERFWDWNLSALLVFLLIDTFMLAPIIQARETTGVLVLQSSSSRSSSFRRRRTAPPPSQPRCRNLIERDAESVPPGAHRNQSDYERNNGVNLNQGSHIRNDSRK
jgi:hypothetical protein